MLKKVEIKNFKSILDNSFELGRVTVLIGENGSGKSNILEAIQFASLAEKYGTIDNALLDLHGLRIGKPTLILSSFKDTKQVEHFETCLTFNDGQLNNILSPTSMHQNSAQWKRKSKPSTYFVDNLDEINESELKKYRADKAILDFKTQLYGNPIFEDTDSFKNLCSFLIYTLNTQTLRGTWGFQKSPIKGLYGETLVDMIREMTEGEREELNEFLYTIPWLNEFFIEGGNELPHNGSMQNFNNSRLYFKDRFMAETNDWFSSENSNEGVLHVLFYLAHLISSQTPRFFAIDNIETSLNPHLCRHVMEEICRLAKEKNKQVIITTHNPAILDGLNLFDDELRLFEVFRTDGGDTRTRRIALKPEVAGKQYKLSELWTRGFLGAISENF